MSDHTLGPWEAVENEKRWGVFRAKNDERLIATISTRVLEQEANARLIAAAPELLEALKSAKTYIADLEKRIRDGVYKSEELNDPNAWKDVDDFAFDGIGASYEAEIDAALAKAEGRLT